MKKQIFLLTITGALFFTACKKEDNKYENEPPTTVPQSTVVKASGDLTTALADFRHLLGDSLNTVPGKIGGRREVNWEGVPASLNNNESFPSDFFNTIDAAAPAGRKRGLIYLNNGTTFRVDSTNFTSIDASYGDQFKAFSGKRTFSGGSSNVTQVVFRVPGQATAAVIKGFGVVFSDVDDPSSTTLEFYNGAKSLGIFSAPVRGANSMSFLGVFFQNETVTRVKITSGNAKLAPGVKDISDGGNSDLVIMDDFFYNEPITQ
jgi:hypothetical protein